MREKIARFVDKYSEKSVFLDQQIQMAEQAIKDAERNEMKGDWEMSLVCLGVAVKVITATIEAVAPYHQEMRTELVDIHTAIDDATCDLLDRRKTTSADEYTSADSLGADPVPAL
jgi:hypothetical protein